MDDIYYMNEALKEAKKAYELAEIPVGCSIVKGNEIIARAHNMRHNLKCSIYHAEILAIQEASKVLDRWILDDCVMYVTLEPCLMCSGAIIQSRISKVVYGLSEERFGCAENTFEYFKNKQNHNVETVKGVLKEDIENLMKTFFKEMREKKKNGGNNV